MKVTVLAGGTSTERDVSLVTSVKVCTALRMLGHKANVIDVFFGSDSFGSAEGFFEEKNDLEKLGDDLKQKTPLVKDEIKKRKEEGGVFFGPGVLDVIMAADIVFMGLHGENGENGKLQAVLDLFGKKYTGPGSLSSAICMDKDITKKILVPEGIPMPKGVTLIRGESTVSDEELPLPCVVKPACGGSSVGVTIAKTPEEREAAVREAFRLEEKVLVEEFISGREFSVGVCDGEAMPVIEIIPDGGVYDYEHKYDPEGAKEICPAEIPEEVSRRMQYWAEQACAAAGIDTYSRVDELMNEKGEIYCLEINTLPGMTPTSLLPQEAAAMGMSYEDLVQKLMDVSLERREEDAF